MGLSRDGRTVLTAAGSQVHRWDAATGQPLRDPLVLPGAGLEESPSVTSSAPVTVAFSPDGQRCLTAAGQEVRLWDTTAGQPLGNPWPHRHVVSFLTFSADGRTALTASGGTFLSNRGETRLWDVATAQPGGTAIPLEGTNPVAALGPDGHTVLTVSGPKSFREVTGIEFRLWDGASGKPLGPARRLPGAVSAAAFSPDGKQLVLASGNTAQVWDAATGQPVGMPLSHQGRIFAVLFSPDGDAVITGSQDRTARCWDARSGRTIGLPLRHPAAVRAVAFSHDGRTLLTGCEDRIARLWRVPPPVPGEVAHLIGAVEARTGLTVSPEGVVRPLEAEAWRERVERAGGAALGEADAAAFPRLQREALRQMDAKEYAAALAALDRLLAAQPDDWLGRVLRARARVERDHLQEAAADFEKAMAVGPRPLVSGWFQSFAAGAMEDKRWPVALWYLDRLVAADGADPWPVIARGRVRAQLGQWDRAEADFAAALGRRPKDPRVAGRVGDAWREHKKWAEAAAAYTRALDAAPDDAPALAARGECHARLGQWDKAAADLSRAVAHRPDDFTLRRRQAAALLTVRDEAGYRRSCADLRGRLNPANPGSVASGFFLRTLFELAPGGLDKDTEARWREWGEKGVAAEPNVCTYKHPLGIICYRAGRYDEAIRWKTEAIQLDTSNSGGTAPAEDYLILAMAYFQKGDKAAARGWLNKAPAPVPHDKANDFWDNVETEVLRREAEELIGVRAASQEK